MEEGGRRRGTGGVSLSCLGTLVSSRSDGVQGE